MPSPAAERDLPRGDNHVLELMDTRTRKVFGAAAHRVPMNAEPLYIQHGWTHPMGKNSVNNRKFRKG